MQLISIRLVNVENASTSSCRGTAKELRELAESMKTTGIIHPIILNSKHEIIAGRRRWYAAKQLDWSMIPAIVCETFDDKQKALLAERDENTCRVKLSPTEIKRLADQLRGDEAPKADERKKAGLKQNREKTSGKDREDKLSSRSGKTDEIVAGAAGTSHGTLKKIDEIVESGEQDLIDEMDKTGKVDPAYKKLKERQEQEESVDPIHDAAIEFCSKLGAYTRQIDAWQKEFADLKKEPLAKFVHWETVVSQLTAVRKAIHQGRPKRRCPYCKATGKKGKAECGTCKGTAHVCEAIYRSGVEAHGVPPGETGGKDDE